MCHILKENKNRISMKHAKLNVEDLNDELLKLWS